MLVGYNCCKIGSKEPPLQVVGVCLPIVKAELPENTAIGKHPPNPDAIDSIKVPVKS